MAAGRDDAVGCQLPAGALTAISSGEPGAEQAPADPNDITLTLTGEALGDTGKRGDRDPFERFALVAPRHVDGEVTRHHNVPAARLAPNGVGAKTGAVKCGA